MTKIVLALYAFLALSRAVAQTDTHPAAALPACATSALAAFDVASVKPSQAGPGDTDMNGAADSFTASASAFHMIAHAYNLRDFQIVDSPDWIKTSTWDVVAKVDQPPANYGSFSTDARQALQRQRMQAVLAQRFALKCHFETRELPVYNLVLAKGGTKLQPTPADASDKGSIHGSGKNHHYRIEGNGVELGDIAKLLSSDVGRTVIDKTGLTGPYSFALTYTSDPDAGSPASGAAAAGPDDPASGPTIFTALEEQLGLKLESAKGPVPVLVVDRIERPSEN